MLISVTNTRPADVHWLYHEAGRFFPEEWSRFRDGVPVADRGEPMDPVAVYHRLLNADLNPDVRAKAAKDWCDWEDAVISLEQGWAPSARYGDPTSG